MKKKLISTSGMIDLAQPRLGTKIVFKTDDFFASADRIISPNEPIWKENVYDEHGKWMDGWESRRRRIEGNDYIILSLGKPGRISIININTMFFNGNQPEYISIDGCFSKNKVPNQNDKWHALVKKSKVKPNYNHYFKTKNKNIFSHIKLNIFPDGGVARIKLYGKISTEKIEFANNDLIELSSILNGTSIIAVNNEHFGKAENILAPGKAFNMGDGWETRRRRDKGFDWLIFKFGIPGFIDKIIIDTSHFKGNYPDTFSLQAAYIDGSKLISKNKIINQSKKWKYLVDINKLNPNSEQFFENHKFINKKVNYVRLNIIPDGGISRINIFGYKSLK